MECVEEGDELAVLVAEALLEAEAVPVDFPVDDAD
jgi:hypothetical protein